MKGRMLALAAVLVFACLPLAQASPFINPPETSPLVPPGGWVHPFPYQRNARIDFDTNPSTWPTDPVQGKDLVLVHGNYDLEGFRDDDLYSSDWFDWTGPFDWIDTDDQRFPGRQGLIGLDRGENAELTLTWHLDNLPEQRPDKHIWVEMEYYIEEDNATVALDGEILVPPPSQEVPAEEPIEEDLGGGWFRLYGWIGFEPNPPWEDINLYLSSQIIVTGGQGTILIDYLHIATECVAGGGEDGRVPEPAGFALLGLPLATLVGRRKRR